MDPRLELQSILESSIQEAYPDLFPDPSSANKYHVYFQPSENVRISYPAIIYSRDSEKTDHASNFPYMRNVRYSVTCIDRNPDSPIPHIIARLQKTSYDRFYRADGLNHDTYRIYY